MKKCLLFCHLLVMLTISNSIYASELRERVMRKLEEMNVENCIDTMGGVAHILDRVSVKDYQNEIQSDGHQLLLHDLWNLKITLHERLRGFHRSSGLTRDCADASRAALQVIRAAEDYVNLNLFKTNNEGTFRFPDNAFEEGNIHVRRHPDFAKFVLKEDLKSGDVILTRGNAYISAAIANLGEYDTQFSHLSLVYKDKEGKLWTVEAHIEVGSFVRSLEDHIADKNYRTMIYRFDDEAMAAKAAEYIFHKVKNASDTTGNINYDFGFDQEDSEELFCSEIISYAFDHVSNSNVKIPFLRSRLQVRKAEFVKMLGINVESSFIPADMEVDPRFRIVAEWRDTNRTMDNLQKDAVMQAMFKWSDDYGYSMKQGSSKKSFIYRNIAWPLRRTPYFKKYVEKKMPLNISRQLIGYFGVLESVGELLQDSIKNLDNDILKERGIPLLKDEKYEFLNNVRLQDSKTKKKLHKMFSPKKSSGKK